MAKIIKYKILLSEVNYGTEEEPVFEREFQDVEIRCKTEAAYTANLPIAEKEAYNGEYTIEDDGQAEPQPEPTTDDVLNALLGVTV